MLNSKEMLKQILGTFLGVIVFGFISLTIQKPVFAQTSPTLKLNFSPDPVITGQELSLTVTVDNSAEGALDINNATLVVNYTTALSQYPKITLGANFVCSTVHLISTNKVTCTGGVIPAGSVVELVFKYTAPYTPYSTGVNLGARATFSPGDLSASDGVLLIPVSYEPDLVVGASVTPTTIKIGETATYTVKVTNIGPLVAPGSRLTVVLQDGTSSHELTPVLYPNQSVSFSYNFIPTLVGLNTATFAVDPDNLIDEVYETNNARVVGLKVVEGYPDLKVVSMSNPVADPTHTSFIRTIVVGNFGEVPASSITLKDLFSKVAISEITGDHGFTCTRIYYSGLYSRTGYQCGGGVLNPGETATVRVVLSSSVSMTISGTFSVDYSNKIVESNETNNSVSYTFQIIK